MFETLIPPAPDPIIALMGQYAADPRPDRIDLGVGVYRDASGNTPVMGAVAAAEARILDAQRTKTYFGLGGDPGFLEAMRALVLADAVPADRVAAVATPGGSGAIRQILELVRAARPDATIWISDPSWPNHGAIARALGFRLGTYRYFDPASGLVDAAAMLADLGQAEAGDVVVLHACCHNPSGADPAPEAWAALADLCCARGLVPFVDVAYLGFGDGLDEDAAAVRLLAGSVPEMLIAVSGSKTFGLYRERVGVAGAICPDAATAQRVGAMLATLNRQNFAFPPDHGARVVQTVLGDPGLRADWLAELGSMRARIKANRHALAAALRQQTQGARFDFVTTHRGMFSLLGLSAAETEALRQEHAVYLVADSRANLAGLREDQTERVARAIATVIGAA
jgi:aromatic-amino-acid transaminase